MATSIGVDRKSIFPAEEAITYQHSIFSQTAREKKVILLHRKCKSSGHLLVHGAMPMFQGYLHLSSFTIHQCARDAQIRAERERERATSEANVELAVYRRIRARKPERMQINKHIYLY